MILSNSVFVQFSAMIMTLGRTKGIMSGFWNSDVRFGKTRWTTTLFKKLMIKKNPALQNLPLQSLPSEPHNTFGSCGRIFGSPLKNWDFCKLSLCSKESRYCKAMTPTWLKNGSCKMWKCWTCGNDNFVLWILPSTFVQHPAWHWDQDLKASSHDLSIHRECWTGSQHSGFVAGYDEGIINAVRCED